MKILPLFFATASGVILTSCVEPHYAGGGLPHADGAVIVERQPVLVERHSSHIDIDDRPHVRADAYPDRRYRETDREQRPYYGDPGPGSSYQPGTTYQRTTTRTYGGY